MRTDGPHPRYPLKLRDFPKLLARGLDACQLLRFLLRDLLDTGEFCVQLRAQWRHGHLIENRCRVVLVPLVQRLIDAPMAETGLELACVAD